MSLHYHTVFLGTSILDCIIEHESKTLVIDTKKYYGDTIQINNCLIEQRLQVFFENDKLVSFLQKVNVAIFLEFVEIKKIFFWNKKFYEIPTSKEDLAENWITLKEKLILSKMIKEENIDFTKLKEETRMVLEGIEFIRNKIIKNFGNFTMFYPVYGYREICEALTRRNAFRGVEYMLEDKIEICENDIKSPYGIITYNNFTKREIKKAKMKHYLVIEYKQCFLNRIFFCIIENKNGKILSLGLDESAKICPKGSYLIYFWREDNEIDMEDIYNLGIEEKHISFKYRYTNDEDFQFDNIL